jgi:hypothetical protein
MRPFLFLYAGALLVPLQPAGAAGPNDGNVPPQQPTCWHQAVVNGRQMQPRPGDLECLDKGTPPSRPLPHEPDRAVDDDLAAIQKILNQYSPSTNPVSNSGR